MKYILKIEMPNGYISGINSITQELSNLQYYLTETGGFESYIPDTIKRLEAMGVYVKPINEDSGVPIVTKDQK